MSYDLTKHDYNDPDPWIALDLDQSTFFDPNAKAALLRGNASKSRQFLLPVVRPLARLSIVLTQVLRIVIPNSMTSSRYLHALIVWGMKTFLSPDANYLIFRHFHIGSQILKFLGDNVENVQVRSHPLKPRALEDFKDNTYVQHDLNIFNFIIEINAQGGQFKPVPPDRMNFSALEEVDDLLPAMPDRWHNFLDLQTAIELYTPLFGLLPLGQGFLARQQLAPIGRNHRDLRRPPVRSRKHRRAGQQQTPLCAYFHARSGLPLDVAWARRRKSLWLHQGNAKTPNGRPRTRLTATQFLTTARVFARKEKPRQSGASSDQVDRCDVTSSARLPASWRRAWRRRAPARPCG